MNRLIAALLAGLFFVASAQASVTTTGAGKAPSGGGGSYSAEATTLFAAMTSSPDSARKGLIDTAIVCLKTNGVWAKEDWLVVMAAGNSHDGLLNWKDPSKTLSIAGSVTFSPVDRGFNVTAVSASNYLLMPELLNAGSNVYSQDSAHFSTYLNLFVFKNFQGIVADGVANYNTSLGQQSGATLFNASVNTTSITMQTGTDATAAHFIGQWTASRTGPTTQVLYKAGSPVNGLNSWSDSSNSTSVPATAQKLLWGDTTMLYDPPATGVRMAFWSSGSGFSSTDAGNEASCVTTFLSAIGAS